MIEHAMLLPLLSDSTVTALQAVAVALLVLIGQYAVAKMSNKVQTKATNVDANSAATTAWQSYAVEMRTRLDGLEDRLTNAERRVRALEAQSTRDLDLIRRLVHRLRSAFRAISDLGGVVAEEDIELADLADLRAQADAYPEPPSKE